MLGFAFYSTLYGSLGSLASRTEDAQAAAGPLIALLVGIYVLAFVVIANPGARWVTIVSMLPPSAPIIMPVRTGARASACAKPGAANRRGRSQPGARP